MLCARVMRGISSIAKAVTLHLQCLLALAHFRTAQELQSAARLFYTWINQPHQGDGVLKQYLLSHCSRRTRSNFCAAFLSHHQKYQKRHPHFFSTITSAPRAINVSQCRALQQRAFLALHVLWGWRSAYQVRKKAMSASTPTERISTIL